MSTISKGKLPNGRQVEIIHLTFGRARIIVGDGIFVEDSW